MMEKVCDFRCWHALGRTCRCICLGKFHGAANNTDGLDADDMVVFSEMRDDPETRKYGVSTGTLDALYKKVTKNGLAESSSI